MNSYESSRWEGYPPPSLTAAAAATTKRSQRGTSSTSTITTFPTCQRTRSPIAARRARSARRCFACRSSSFVPAVLHDSIGTYRSHYSKLLRSPIVSASVHSLHIRRGGTNRWVIVPLSITLHHNINTDDGPGSVEHDTSLQRLFYTYSSVPVYKSKPGRFLNWVRQPGLGQLVLASILIPTLYGLPDLLGFWRKFAEPRLWRVETQLCT